MKSIAVASAFILAASAAAVPFIEKSSDTVVRRMNTPVEVHATVPFQQKSDNKNRAPKQHQSGSNNKSSHTVDGSVVVNNRPQRREKAKNSSMSGDSRHNDKASSTEEPAAPEDPEAKNSTLTKDPAAAEERNSTTSSELRRRTDGPVEVHIVPFHQTPANKNHAASNNKPASNKPGYTVDGTVAVNNRPQRRYNATTTEEPAAAEDPEARNSTMTEGPAEKNSTSELRRRDGPTDTQILQYALTLEHLEKAFYDGALKKFNQQAFVKAGLPAYARQLFEQIAEHEATHVEFLTTALGPDAVAACNYTFPYHDPKSFAALSMVLEGVGVSAYLGAAQFIQNKEYLTAAGAILTTESRHSTFVSGAIDNASPWSGAFDTPLDFNQVFSLAAPFITGCPTTNPSLPVKAFPTLEVKNKHYKAGDYITLKFDATPANGQPMFLAIFSGLETMFVTIENKRVQLPKDLEGTSYGVVTTSGTAVSDQNTLAGVAIFELAY